jgi:hypothetical protein
MILIIGTISFLEEEHDDLTQYTDKERFAIVHSINIRVECKDEEEAETLGEEAINMGFDSYLIPELYEVNGDIQYDCEEEGFSPIDVDSFKQDFLN